MDNKIQELKKDIAELEALEKQCSRPKVKGILSIEARKLVSEVVKLEEELKEQIFNNKAEVSSTSETNKRYEIQLNRYAWDQTSKHVKFYVTLEKVDSLPSGNITCQFSNKFLELKVKDLQNKDYVFKINNLLKTILPEQSSWKVKKDMVIISAAKEEQQDWSHVTEWEHKSSIAQKIDSQPKMDDPTDGLMSLLKNMYQTGDDDMKRTIAKAWTDSQNKQV